MCKKIIFIFLFWYQLGNSQTINLVTQPDATGQYGLPSRFWIEYAGKYYYMYTDASSKNRLAQYDGTSISFAAGNPDAGVGYTDGSIIYNGNLYFNYRDASLKYRLAKYDGTNITLVTNPDSGDGCTISTETVNGIDIGHAIVFAGNLYFRYLDASGKYRLAKYDGTTITLVTNPDSGAGFFGSPIVYNNTLYFIYKNAFNANDLAKYDGTNITIITKPDGGQGIMGNTIIHGGNLFFTYQDQSNKLRLAKYDGTSLTFTAANPDSGIGMQGMPVVYANNLYFKYTDTNSFGRLAKYDGSSITLLVNPDNGLGNYDQTIIYGSNLYFAYSDISNKLRLAKYDGTTISLINNPDSQGSYAGRPVVANGTMYLLYIDGTSYIVKLGKFDGTNFTLPFTGPNVRAYSAAVFGAANQLIIEYDTNQDPDGSPNYQLGYLQLTNPSDTVLTQIGNEGDSPNVVPSVVTTTQLGQITPAITGIITANQSAYQGYIDANPNSFSTPATAAEVQAMVTAVNAVIAASTAVLTQIGNEGDSPNTVLSVVTTTQLGQIVPAITGIIAANQTAYQGYIDANPNLFAAPATAAEVQAMVTAVNLSLVTTIYYVDGSKADNTGDGLSWATAKKDLQVVLDNYGNNPGPNVNEVWVKAGNYTPTAFVGTTEAARDKAFWVKGNIKIYGGFNGTETALNQRDIVNNQTLLDGTGGYHTMLITNSNATSTYTLIDGVIIKGGNANGTTTNTVDGTGYERNFGGGVLCYQNAPVFNNVIFKANGAEYGAAVFNQSGAPKYTNCVFTGNTSTSYGGAIENFANATPIFANCIISNNSAFRGGAAANNGGTATYINCTIVNNIATVATAGGAFHNLNSTTCISKNCIIWGNTAGDFLTEAGSTLNVSYSVTQTTVSGSSNLITNPLLVDINDGDGADNQWLTSDDGFRIMPSSNGINSGDATAIPSYITLDILNHPRIEGSGVDRGPYEISASSLSIAVLTQIGNEGDSPNTVSSVVTATQLGQILPALTGIVTANQAAYQTYIDANPNSFSAPATAAEVQVMINTVNAQEAALAASNAVLVQIGNEGDAPNTVPSVVTTAQLGVILPAITGIITANQTAYQTYIDANPSSFSAPATAAEVQAMVTTVNAQVIAQAASNAVLAQIGVEGDDPDDIISEVTTAQLAQILPAITGIITANQTAYEIYIDDNPNSFSAPATAAEVQAMVTTVNAQVAALAASNAVLVQIGNEGDAPNTVPSVVTTAQLGVILPAITGIITANQTAYQTYIDANPSLFSAPATAVEVQAMVTAVNTALTVNDLDISTISLYPNPSTGIFAIDINSNATMELYDVLGKRLEVTKIAMGTTVLNLSNYANGVYFLNITNEGNQTKTVRLIKK